MTDTLAARIRSAPTQDEALAVVRAMVADHRSLEVLTALWPEPLTRPLYTIEDMERYAKQAAAVDLGAAWERAERALPEGWRPITVGPPDPDAYDVAGNPVTEAWCASTASPAFFEGETDRDDEWAAGYGPTPAAALTALAEKLEAGR